MKTTGVVRCLDALGRVVIPKEMRNILNIHNGDPVEITLGEHGSVVVRKFAVDGELSSCIANLKNAVASFEENIPSSVYDKLITSISDISKLVKDVGKRGA